MSIFRRNCRTLRDSLSQKGETDETWDRETNEETAEAGSDCLYIDLSTGSCRRGNALYQKVYSYEGANGFDGIVWTDGRRRNDSYSWHRYYGDEGGKIRRQGVSSAGYGKYIPESEILLGQCEPADSLCYAIRTAVLSGFREWRQ